MRNVIAVIAVVLVLGIGYSAAQQRRNQPAPRAKVKYVPPPRQRMPLGAMNVEPAFPVTVSHTLDLADDGKALYEQMAKQLTGLAAVPDDRLNFYSAVLQAYRIRGWMGMVDHVEPIPGGYLVTVLVGPDIEPTDEIGPIIGVFSRYAEQYRVVNGVIQYAGCLDPENMAGKMPGMLSM
jgi:hypothetical protein